ncbi:biliverdin-producing heme oxygenase [Sphingobacterium sp. NPDC055346]
MLSKIIKEETKGSHQRLEAKMVRIIKKIKTEAEYATFLKSFYAYFHAVEQETGKFINTEILPDKALRRDSSYILADIQSLGFDLSSLPPAEAPKVENKLQALSSFYVLEGSIMGGPYIVQMLKKNGITKGFSFFEGYGDQSQEMWKKYTDALNKFASDPSQEKSAIDIANQTFDNFEEVFMAEIEK